MAPTRYGYIGIFSALALGILGLPVPDEVLLTYVGYNVFQGKMMYLLALVSAFWRSYRDFNQLRHRFEVRFAISKKVRTKIHITQQRIERKQSLFKKYGNIVLIVGYFIPGIRHLTAYIAGISHWTYGNL